MSNRDIGVRRLAWPTQRGFTLVEMVIAIVLIGIIGGMVAVFMKSPIQGYFDTRRRADLTDAADGVVRRIARDVHAALPNSIRSTTGGSNQCFEFLPMVGGGRYRLAQSSTATGDILDFSTADSTFDVLAASGLPPSPGFSTTTSPYSPYHAVIYNLGNPGADAYEGTNRAQIASGSDTNIVLSSGLKFPFVSPGRRFQVIQNQSVVYSCTGGSISRWTRTITTTPLADCTPTGSNIAVLVNNVDCSTKLFDYTPVVDTRNGLLAITLVLTQKTESVRLYQEVHVNNTP